MDVTYPPSVNPIDKPYLERTTELLKTTIKTTSSGVPTTSGEFPSIATTRDVGISWSTRAVPGQPSYLLTITSSGVQVSSEFYPADLQDRSPSPLLPFRMARLWGDLLEKLSHKQFGEFMKGLELGSNA